MNAHDRAQSHENADVLPVCALPEIPRDRVTFALQKRPQGDHDVKISLAKFSPRATLWGEIGNPIN
jgi:hypothetical protein